VNEWATAVHAVDYLERGQAYPPHRTEGEELLLASIPEHVDRVLDLGSGDGRLLALVLATRAEAQGVAADFSPAMLDACRARFAGDERVNVVDHNLDDPLPATLGTFDVVVSSFAIHHCTHDRKQQLYGEVFERLAPGGVFCNLEHVASPTPELHERFFQLIDADSRREDPSNKLLDVETQLQWLREIGFTHVDCHWKWMELALLAGVKPG
jgi:tRNA (cmo5U34)-methyltransferase